MRRTRTQSRKTAGVRARRAGGGDPMREAIAEIAHEVIAEIDPFSVGVKVSQRTVERVRGIAPRAFLEHTRHPDLAPQVLKVGKLRIVAIEAYDAFLARLDEHARTAPAGAWQVRYLARIRTSIVRSSMRPAVVVTRARTA